MSRQTVSPESYSSPIQRNEGRGNLVLWHLILGAILGDLFMHPRTYLLSTYYVQGVEPQILWEE